MLLVNLWQFNWDNQEFVNFPNFCNYVHLDSKTDSKKQFPNHVLRDTVYVPILVGREESKWAWCLTRQSFCITARGIPTTGWVQGGGTG